MRQELAEIMEIESYLFKQMPEDDKAVFDVKLLLQPELKRKLDYQKTVYRLIRFFSRNKERERFEKIFEELTKDKTFAKKLKTIFR